MFRNAILRTACFAILSASAAAASPLAMSAAAAPPFKSSAAFGEPINEAVALVRGKKFTAALSKVEQAAPLAKSSAERLAVEQLRTAIYSGLGRRADLIKSLEAQMEIGGLPQATVKAHRKTLAGLYGQQNNDDKAVTLTKAYIADYGGEPEQYAFVAGHELKAKQYSEALSFATKAIAKAESASLPVPEAWRQIVMRAEFESGNLPGYYTAVEKAAAHNPKPEYFRTLAERAVRDTRFNRSRHQLEVYRALQGAGVALTPVEQADMAERAFTRGLAGEAAAGLKSIAASGYAGFDAPTVERLKRMRAQAVADAKTALDRRAAAANAAPKGGSYLALGEAYSAAGDQPSAIVAIRKGIALGDLDAGEVDFARLQLGIAQFRAAQVEQARKTWGEISSDNGASSLARVWRLISTKPVA